MTTEEILNGTFDIEEKLSREELKYLIGTLHKVKLTNENVDNVIKFLGYAKQHEYNVIDNVTWYILFILDRADNENFDINHKIVSANKDITKIILEFSRECKKEDWKGWTVWQDGDTSLPFDTAKELYEKGKAERELKNSELIKEKEFRERTKGKSLEDTNYVYHEMYGSDKK